MFYAACELFASSLIFMKTGKSGTLIYSSSVQIHGREQNPVQTKVVNQ
jgi:hypothetical protein